MVKLPLEIVEHELSEEERVRPDCGELMQPFGVDTRDEIKIIPARVVHLQHRYHYDAKVFDAPAVLSRQDSA